LPQLGWVKRSATDAGRYAATASPGPAPLIATALLAQFGSGYAVALYIFFCAIVSIVSTSLLPDYTNRDISAEHDQVWCEG
jgi:hypothetical protein